MTPLPLLGTDAQFAALRESLQQAGFTEPRILERLKIDSLPQLLSTTHSGQPATAGDPLEFLTGVFVVGRRIEHSLFLAVPQRLRQAVTDLGLLVDEPGRTGFLYCPVALYPTQGRYVVSDRWNRTDGKVADGFSDCVYPAITRNTQFFMHTLPGTPCEALLELFSGTGLAAFVGAAHAKRAWAVDITERATVCAEFGRRLNGLDNVTVLRGDLFAPVSGLTFDRIFAHPPYMPVMRPGYVFYDGGEDGEQLSRRTIEQLPEYLRPGGTYYSVAMGADTASEPFEQRIRSWLGPADEEFDVALIVKRTVTPSDFATDATVRSSGGPDEVAQWLHFFRTRNVRNLILGEIVLHRHAKARPAFTARRERGAESGPAEVDWLLRWEAAAAADPGDALAGVRPRFSAWAELGVTHRWEKGGLAPAGFVLSTDYPFDTDCELESWAAKLISACDGRSTLRDLFDIARSNALLPEKADFAEFSDYLRTLISGGFLEIQEFPLPRRKA